MRYRLLIICIYCSLTWVSHAQDPLFSQFYHSPVYLNPGFTGCGKNEFRASYTGRLQWMRLPSPLQYHTLSLDKYFPDYNVSAGAIVNHFSEGYIRTTEVAGTFAKNFGSDGFTQKEWFLNFAMQFGFAWKNADKNKLLFADQLTINGANGQQSQVELFENTNKPYFDVSTGFIFTYGNVMIGASAHHLNQPQNGLIGSASDSKLPRRYTAHISFIKDGYSNNEGAVIIKPTAILNMQGESKSLMLGSLFDLPERQLEFGLWYRNNLNFSNNHSLVIGVNIKFGKEKNYYNGDGNSRYRAGISYDAEINKPGVRYTSGSTEMGILYEGSSESCPKPSGGSGYTRFPWEFH
jgi:type IX secretion system PorP/SprF family membrane protein